ncbi:BtpA/SgcQ family protein [Thalassoroseus pseudoceratinae]|uniref:BtpA/SgcQ family protein n=1 Tax=Thalassoroseus pseudoceratinae TaxID=2713176 RepID=UPI0014224B6C|nr:BtpA/SgcQ family protein [Thalassoroseus pseudoceratinae]
MRLNLPLTFTEKHPLTIGMVHLRPLPGSPKYSGEWGTVIETAIADAKALERGGVDAVMVENFGDTPFFPGRVPPVTVAAMSVVTEKIRCAIELPLGVNVLRNDGESALAIAVVADASFIRVNVLSGARVTDQGVIQGSAHDLLRLRKHLNGEHVKILADVDVKHSAAVAVRPFAEELDDLVRRGGADAVIVSGSGTGAETSPQQIEEAISVANGTPILVGSGVSATNLPEMPIGVGGLIVGTSFKRGGEVQEPVDEKRVATFMRELRGRWN